jgi:hypothetical protein
VGPSWQWGGWYDRWARAGKRKERKRKENRINSNLKLKLQIYSNFIRSKHNLHGLQIFEIKYGWKEFETRDNFSYINILGFDMDFELKFRKFSRSRKQEKIDWKFLGTRILMKLGHQLPFYTLLQGKLNSQQNQIRNLNSF